MMSGNWAEKSSQLKNRSARAPQRTVSAEHERHEAQAAQEEGPLDQGGSLLAGHGRAVGSGTGQESPWGGRSTDRPTGRSHHEVGGFSPKYFSYRVS